MKKENNKGVTLIALAITIAVLIIIASITIKFGSESINKAKVQNIKTNMLLIEAKTKEFVENANYDLGIKPDEATDEMKEKSNSELEGEGKGTKITSSSNMAEEAIKIGINSTDISEGRVILLTTSDLENMGIKGVESNEKDGLYIVVYDVTNSSVKVYNTKGIQVNGGETKYCLDEIRDED